MSQPIDHRQLADEMEIFFFDDQIGPGLPVWLPHGVAIRDALEQFVQNLERKSGYQKVSSPHIGKSQLYQCSGHLRSFQENMFPPMKWPDDASEYYLKPMNCPHHHKVFASSPRSYKQLPLRISEYGQVYRFENSGSLRGLSRVRGLCQNDAHIYVDPKDAIEEICNVLKLQEQCYSALQLKGYHYRLSLHDPQRPDDFDGAAEQWASCESILRQCLQKMNLPFVEAIGEAAFYGPKIDVQMKVGGGPEESIASVQLDFNSGKKFQLQYVNSSGEPENPWVIHRAPLGSHERFIAMLLEYFNGQLPGWLAPIQVYLIPVAKAHQASAIALKDQLLEVGIRADIDLNSGSLSKRLLFAHRYRPFAKIILGNHELNSKMVKLQFRDQSIEVSLEVLPLKLKDFIHPSVCAFDRT